MSSDFDYKKKENVEIPIETPPPSGENSPSSKEGISFEEMYRDTEFNQQGEVSVFKFLYFFGTFVGKCRCDMKSIYL